MYLGGESICLGRRNLGTSFSHKNYFVFSCFSIIFFNDYFSFELKIFS